MSQLEQAIESFVLSLQARAYALVTLKVYRSDLKRFSAWVCEHRDYSNLSDFTRSDFVDYSQDLALAVSARGRLYSSRTRNRHLTTLRSFFSHLIKSGHLLSNPASDVSSFRTQKPLPKLPSYEDILKLIAAVDTGQNRGIRDRAWLEVFYGSGIRLSELLALNLTDFSPSQETLHIRFGKYGIERFVPLTPEAIKALNFYLKTARPSLVRSGETALFVSLRGGGRMNRLTVGRWLSRYAQAANLELKITAHTLRHCCATHLLKNKASLRHIQQLLGHQNLSTTQIYTRIEVSDLHELLQRYHPREAFEK